MGQPQSPSFREILERKLADLPPLETLAPLRSASGTPVEPLPLAFELMFLGLTPQRITPRGPRYPSSQSKARTPDATPGASHLRSSRADSPRANLHRAPRAVELSTLNTLESLALANLKRLMPQWEPKRLEERELKATYRALALKLHPDTNPGLCERALREKRELFEVAKSAYELLRGVLERVCTAKP